LIYIYHSWQFFCFSVLPARHEYMVGQGTRHVDASRLQNTFRKLPIVQYNPSLM